MPAGLGASYSSLSEDAVYKSTTTTATSPDKFSVLDSVKKAFQFASSPHQYRSGSTSKLNIGHNSTTSGVGGIRSAGRHSSLDTVSLRTDVDDPHLIIHRYVIGTHGNCHWWWKVSSN
jgi:hypothetical protein